MDLRERIVAAVDEGMTQSQAAERFGVSLRTVERYLARRRGTGSLGATEQRHGAGAQGGRRGPGRTRRGRGGARPGRPPPWAPAAGPPPPGPAAASAPAGAQPVSLASM